MHTVTGSPIYKGSTRQYSIRDVMMTTCEEHAALDAFIFRRKPTLPEERRTFAQLGDDIKYLGTYISHSKYQGDKLAVVGENAYEWIVSYSAILGSDSIGVPLDRALPEGELVALLDRASVKVLFYQQKHHEMMVSIAKKLDSGELKLPIEKFVCMYPEGISSKCVWPEDDDRFVKFNDLVEEGKKYFEEGDHSFLERKIDPDAIRIILFTSGTTSMSKGVLLTNKNITSNIFYISETLYVEPGERAFSILPLHHTFENTCDFFLLSRGVALCLNDGLRYISKNISEWHCEICISVPLLFENIYGKVKDGIAASGKEKLVNFMMPVAAFLKRCGLDVRRKIFSDVLKKLGGDLRLVVIGGAGIDKKYIKYFNALGIDFLMGYGLTETSPVISTTTLDCNVYGSVGRPMDGITVAILRDPESKDKTGEIICKSDCVMKGYYNNEEATAEAIDKDGWFHTGDMGYIDKKNCIHVTGRVKSMIVLTNGKKAFPEEIEALLAEIPGVKEVFVWPNANDRNAYDICAKLLIDRSAVANALEIKGEANDGDVSQFLIEKVKEVNHSMPAYKSVHHFVFSEEDMIKTTTLKIKRPKEKAAIEDRLKFNKTTMKEMDGKNLDRLNKQEVTE